MIINTLTEHTELKKILKDREIKLKQRENDRPNKPGKFKKSFLGRVKSQELCSFTRQLATMIEARLSLTRSLEILISQMQNNKFRNIVEDILARVRGGTSFARSLSFHRNVFSNLFISMVNVGEVAGVLDLTLNRLAAHLEKIATLKRKLMTAMSYPAVIILVAIGAITFLLTAIVPTFADLFHDFGAELPMLTRLIIDIGEGVKSYGIFFIIFLIIAILFIRRYTETGTGKLLKDKLLLLLPLWGNFLKKILIARFCRTLGTLLESGVSLLEALDVAAGISGNKVFETEIHHMKQYATRGGFIADSVLNSTIFPPLVSQMMHVGEETAKLEIMSHKLADFYEEEVNATIDTLTSIIEPVIIVFLGIILGGTVVAMYLQIFNLMDVIQ